MGDEVKEMKEWIRTREVDVTGGASMVKSVQVKAMRRKTKRNGTGREEGL